jgi:hypothetical protein
MFVIENKVGRLVELWVRSPVSIEEVGKFRERLGAVLRGVPGKVVICTDLTFAKIFAPDVAEAFTNMMRADNPKLERSGFLLGRDAATFGMQLERIIRDAANPSRRTFREGADLVTWIGQVLDEAERERVQQFLAEPRV